MNYGYIVCVYKPNAKKITVNFLILVYCQNWMECANKRRFYRNVYNTH